MRSLNRLLNVLPKLVNARTGIVQSCYELPPEADSPQFFHYYARTSNTGAFSAQDNFRNNGGVATSRRMAIAKAVGESIERYSSALYSVDDCPLVSSKNADFKHLPPEDFSYYTPSQYQKPGFQFRPFLAETPVRWTSVVDLQDYSEVFVPAASIWMPYYYAPDIGELPILQPISTGLSCHCSVEEAVEGALLEVIERDAFSITWQAALSWPQVRVESLDETNYALLRDIERTGYRIALVNATTDVGIPVILSVAYSSSKPNPPLVVGAAAALGPEEAIRKSLEELVHTRRYMREVQDWMEPFDPGENYENITEQVQHLRLWGQREMIEHSQFLVSNEDRIDFEELDNLFSECAADNVNTILTKLADLDLRAYVANLTTPDVGALGLNVVKTIVPGLHPFFIGHGNRARAHPRLFSVPTTMGLKELSLGEDNPVPHPFP